MSANPLGSPSALAPAPSSTALSAVFRRLAHEPPAAVADPAPVERAPQMHGFEPAVAAAPAAAAAPVSLAPPIEPFVPTSEDLAALAPLAPAPIAVLEAAPRRPPQPAPNPIATAVKAVAPAAIPALDRAGREHLSRNRRLYRRVTLAAEMEVGGVPCELIDISVGGFAATGLSAVAANAVAPVSLRIVIDGIEVGTQLNARIIYANEARSSGRFIDPSASQTAFLRYLVTWRGESVGAVGATTLLDAISGGADRAAAAAGLESLAGATKERWWAGIVGRKVAPPR